jgi:hypothetical protein
VCLHVLVDSDFLATHMDTRVAQLQHRSPVNWIIGHTIGEFASGEVVCVAYFAGMSGAACMNRVGARNT